MTSPNLKNKSESKTIMNFQLFNEEPKTVTGQQIVDELQRVSTLIVNKQLTAEQLDRIKSELKKFEKKIDESKSGIYIP